MDGLWTDHSRRESLQSVLTKSTRLLRNIRLNRTKLEMLKFRCQSPKECRFRRLEKTAVRTNLVSERLKQRFLRLKDVNSDKMLPTSTIIPDLHSVSGSMLTGGRSVSLRGKNGARMILLKEKVVLPKSTLDIDVQAGNLLGSQEAEVNTSMDISWPSIGAPVIIRGPQQNVIQIATMVHDARILEVDAIMRSVSQGHREILGQGRRTGTPGKKQGHVQVQGIIAALERKWMSDSDAGRSMTSLLFPVDVHQTDKRRERDRKWKVGTGEMNE